jgi:hypothetical protein
MLTMPYDILYQATDDQGREIWASYLSQIAIAATHDAQGLLQVLNDAALTGWQVVAIGDMGWGPRHEILIKGPG